MNAYDYISDENPTGAVNPKLDHATWLNITTGEVFVCDDPTVGQNYWVGQQGTIVNGVDPYDTSITVLAPFDVDYRQERSGGAMCLQYWGSTWPTADNVLFGHNTMKFASSGGIDYLYSEGLDFGTGDFTIEWWLRIPTGATHTDGQVSCICNGRQSVSASLRGYDIHIFDNSSGQVRFENLQASGNHYTYGHLGDWFARDQWYHICVERVSGTTTVYIDGVDKTTSGATAQNGIQVINPNKLSCLIGRGGSGITSYNWFLTGFLSEIRATKGAARYQGAFTPKSWINPKAAQ